MKQITINKQVIGDDIALYLNLLLSKEQEDLYITFEKDEYEFHSKYAYEAFCYITNNDYSLKQIAFPLVGKKNITIDGGGATFMMTGHMLPFFVINSENITLKNFTIDYKRAMFSQGTVVEANDAAVTLAIDKTEFPYEIKNGIIHFTGEDYCENYLHGFLAYDPVRRGPADFAIDTFTRGLVAAEEIAEGVVRFDVPFDQVPAKGALITIKHERRFAPAIAIDHSKELHLSDITVHQAGTMAVVCQFCHNVTLDAFNVASNRNTNRVVSANADATHFVGCTGLVSVSNCLFESQLDDALNVHGNYLVVDKVVSNRSVLIQIGHFQQVGIFGMEEGGTIGILEEKSMLTCAKLTLASKEIINKEYALLTFVEEFAFDPNTTYCVEDVDSYPELLFQNNVVQSNRARGILVATTKKAVIENNRFITEGSAIKISTDVDFWYESGAVENVIIRNNYLERRNYKNWGKGVIDIDSQMETFVDGVYYNKRIEISNNTIVLDHSPIVYGYNVETLVLQDNKIMGQEDVSDSTLPLDVQHIGSLVCQGNTKA